MPRIAAITTNPNTIQQSNALIYYRFVQFVVVFEVLYPFCPTNALLHRDNQFDHPEPAASRCIIMQWSYWSIDGIFGNYRQAILLFTQKANNPILIAFCSCLCFEWHFFGYRMPNWREWTDIIEVDTVRNIFEIYFNLLCFCVISILNKKWMQKKMFFLWVSHKTTKNKKRSLKQKLKVQKLHHHKKSETSESVFQLSSAHLIWMHLDGPWRSLINRILRTLH